MEAVKTGAFPQVPSFGPYALKVIVPVALMPPITVALSEIDPPNGTEAEAWVLNPGVTCVTVRYFASLGMPFVNTVSSEGPGWKPLSGVEVNAVFDQPAVASTGRKATSLLSMLRSCTIG